MTFVCSFCTCHYDTNSLLRMHIRRKHPGHQLPENLKKGKKVDTEKLIFPSMSCKTTFSSQQYLMRHMNRCHKADKSGSLPCCDKKFACSICKVEFKRNSVLRKHIKVQHPGEEVPQRNRPGRKVDASKLTIQCHHCNMAFTTKSSLVRHIAHCQKINNPGSQSFMSKRFVCSVCILHFDENYLLRMHIKKRHPNHHIPNTVKLGRKVISTKSAFLCCHCSATLSSKLSLRSHIARYHKIKKLQNLPCPVTACDKSFCLRRQVLDHIMQMHKSEASSLIIRKNFMTQDAFDKWREEEEDSSMERYVKRASSRNYLVYICHRSGQYISKGTCQRHFKIQGSCKAGRFCSSFILLHKVAGHLEMAYLSKHRYHGKLVHHVHLCKKERLLLAADLANGVSMNVLLNKIRDNLPDHLNRKVILCRKDLFNIARDFAVYGIPKFSDAESVLTWIEALQNKENEEGVPSPVLFAKFQGQEHTDLHISDFMLIIQNNLQFEMMCKFPKIICMDSTHRTTGYDFQLVTVLVIDEYGEGFPAAFCYCNRADKCTISVFLERVKERIGTDVHKIFGSSIFMSDMADEFATSWSSVMGKPAFQLYCAWHIDRAWRKNLSKIKGGRKKQMQVYKALRVVMQQKSEDDFKELFLAMKNELLEDEETEEFGKYLCKHYEPIQERWAYCYRRGLHIHHNMHLESLHRQLKKVVMKGKTIHRLDRSIKALLELIKNKTFDRLRKLTVSKVTTHIQGIRNRHVRSLKMIPKYTVHSISKEKWQLSCDVNKSCVVVKEVGHEDGNLCPLCCDDCKICVHSFSCTCNDYSLRNTICKHIHLLQYYKKDGEIMQCTLDAQPQQEEAELLFQSLTPPVQQSGAQFVARLQNACADLMDTARTAPICSENDHICQTAIQLVKDCKAFLTASSQPLNAKPDSLLPGCESNGTTTNLPHQQRFFSTKRKRKQSEVNFAQPSSKEVQEIVSGLKKTSIQGMCDHNYCKKLCE